MCGRGREPEHEKFSQDNTLSFVRLQRSLSSVDHKFKIVALLEKEENKMYLKYDTDIEM